MGTPTCQLFYCRPCVPGYEGAMAASLNHWRPPYKGQLGSWPIVVTRLQLGTKPFGAAAGQAPDRQKRGGSGGPICPGPVPAVGRVFDPLPRCSTRTGGSWSAAASCGRFLGTAAGPLSRPSGGPLAATGRAAIAFARAETAVPCDAPPPEASADTKVADPIKATGRLSVPLL
jgi:hypothetical protein